jgi:hypothetical protein
MKKSILLLAFTIIALSTSLHAADPKAGQFGLGWYSASAPVGGRVWLNEMVGVDIGLGFADKNALNSDKARFHVNIGVPVNVVRTDEVNFFIRPGIEFQSNSRLVNGETKGTAIITADLGAEWFVTKQFSLSVGHGLQFEQTTVSGEDKWGVTALRALGFNNLGFHFYFN